MSNKNESRDLTYFLDDIRQHSSCYNLETLLVIVYDRETNTHECLYVNSETGNRLVDVIKTELSKIKSEGGSNV